MDAVGADATGDARVAGDHRRGARLLGDWNQRLGRVLEGGFAEAMGRQDERGDVAAGQGVGEAGSVEDGGAISTRRQRFGGGRSDIFLVPWQATAALAAADAT